MGIPVQNMCMHFLKIFSKFTFLSLNKMIYIFLKYPVIDFINLHKLYV